MKRFALVLIIALSFVPTACFADDASANKFVKDLSGQALSIIKEGSSEAEKRTKLETMFKANVDTSWMGKFVLGKYLRSADEAQKQKFLTLYQEYLVRSYVPKFKEYNGGDLVIQKVSAGETQGQYIVQTILKNRGDGKADVRVDYRLAEEGGSFKVIDVIGEGVSLLTTQRTDFGSVVSQKGLDHFLGMLESKLNKMRSKDSATS